MKKRFFSLLLALMLVLSLLPFGASAADIVDSGTCGENLTWTLDSDGLLTISGTGAMTSHPWTAADIKAVVIESGVTSIGDYAFFRCTDLTNITIPDSVTSIGNYAFSECTSLKNVTIPSSVTCIGQAALGYVKDIYYDDGLAQWKTVWPYDFSSSQTLHASDFIGSYGTCGSNLSWTLDSNGLLTISGTGPMYNYYYNSPFHGNSAIRSAAIESGVTSIGNYAFQGSTGLTSITIPDSVTSIGERAFSECTSLKNVTIPSSVTSVGNSAFSGCSNLQDVYYGGSPQEWKAIEIDRGNEAILNSAIHCKNIPAGWYQFNGKWYYYENGAAVTGWKKVSNVWYYFNADGVMQTGWQKLGGVWYYFKSGGQMVTGWQKIGNVWYFFEPGGAMQTGWQTIGGKTYYLKPSGAMAANEWCNGWWLNADGSWTYPYKGSWHQNAKGWWFGDESGWYAKSASYRINDVVYTFDANGYMK